MSDLIKDLREAVEAAEWTGAPVMLKRAVAAALLKLVEGERWIPVEEALPDSSTPVIAYHKTSFGKGRRIRAFYVPARTKESDGFDDLELDYCEADDTYYIPEGWYECIEHWDEYGFITVHDEITHWRPLPTPPQESNDD